MDPVPSLVIHEIFPTEILEVIFEEHAVLEWEAPTVDGQVCRLWREIILNTPRVWAYFEIRDDSMPSMGEVRMRLHRSRTAPLHIDTRAAGRDTCQRLYDIFSGHHTRIASLRTRYCGQSFFEGRDFPCMQLLDIARWYTFRLGSMPKLQSLRLLAPQLRMVSLSGLAPLKMLALSWIKCTSVLQYSRSLTTLMISHVSLMDTILGLVTFPSLTYLSLSGVTGLKPHVNAPRLVTYHEEGLMADESFSIPLPSLVEYGVYHSTASDSYPAMWHLSFPNIQRLAIRAADLGLLSFFTSLAKQPHVLPALQTISAGGRRGRTYQIAEGVQEKIVSLVLVRNEACDRNVVLYIETVAPFHIPIFFGTVSDLPIMWSCAFLTHILGTGPCYLKTFRFQVLACIHLSGE